MPYIPAACYIHPWAVDCSCPWGVDTWLYVVVAFVVVVAAAVDRPCWDRPW